MELRFIKYKNIEKKSMFLYKTVKALIWAKNPIFSYRRSIFKSKLTIKLRNTLTLTQMFSCKPIKQTILTKHPICSKSSSNTSNGHLTSQFPAIPLQTLSLRRVTHLTQLPPPNSRCWHLPFGEALAFGCASESSWMRSGSGDCCWCRRPNSSGGVSGAANGIGRGMGRCGRGGARVGRICWRGRRRRSWWPSWSWRESCRSSRELSGWLRSCIDSSGGILDGWNQLVNLLRIQKKNVPGRFLESVHVFIFVFYKTVLRYPV